MPFEYLLKYLDKKKIHTLNVMFFYILSSNYERSRTSIDNRSLVFFLQNLILTFLTTLCSIVPFNKIFKSLRRQVKWLKTKEMWYDCEWEKFHQRPNDIEVDNYKSPYGFQQLAKHISHSPQQRGKWPRITKNKTIQMRYYVCSCLY